MPFIPSFPTTLHREAAESTRDYFLNQPATDTVLAVNSCARGQAVAGSDLDFAILVKPGTSPADIKNLEAGWQNYSHKQASILKYKQSGKFAHLHLDIIDGTYAPAPAETGTGPDFFEIEIGNQVCYSAPMDEPGTYFKELQSTWLPYYGEVLRSQRLPMARDSCSYDLEQIPFFVKRGLYFQAFDSLCKAFREYLQTLFIYHKTYPIAYNKWIREQVVKWLNRPELYPRLSPVLSVSNIESDEINAKVKMLSLLLDDIPQSAEKQNIFFIDLL